MIRAEPLSTWLERWKAPTSAVGTDVYARYFPNAAHIFVNVPAWPGRFDIEIDCIAAR